jgi:hypothetical protein
MIWIDNIPYDADYSDFQRSAELERKYDLTTADGVKHGEIAGIYYKYNLTLGNMAPELYDAVFQALIASGDYRTITLPEGRDKFYTFSAKVTGITDRLIADPEPYDTMRLWDELSVTLEARVPYTAEGQL